MNVRAKKFKKGRYKDHYYVRLYRGPGNKPFKLLEKKPNTLTFKEAQMAAEAFADSLKVTEAQPGVKPNITACVHAYLTANATTLSERSKNTMKAYLKSKYLPFWSDRAVEDMSALDIERYKSHRLDQISARHRKTQGGTVNREVAFFLSAVNKAEELGLVKVNPFAGRKIKRLKPEPRLVWFERDEWDRFLAAFSQPEKMLAVASGNQTIIRSAPIRSAYLYNTARGYEIFQTILLTCSRLSEILELPWSAVNFRTNRITIKLFKTRKKGKEFKDQEMTLELAAMLKNLFAQSRNKAGYVFTRQDGHRFTVDQVERIFRTAMKVAGLPPTKLDRYGKEVSMTPHIIRHTACSWLATARDEKGRALVTLQMIMELAGHQSINSTMVYAHLTPESVSPSLSILASDHGKQQADNDSDNKNALTLVK